MAPRNSTSTPSKPPLRILMLHGFTQSGTLFKAKTGALTKAIARAFPLHAVSFSYPTGPLRLRPSDVPGYKSEESSNNIEDGDDDKDDIEAYGWWRRPASMNPPIEYRGIEDGFRSVAQTLRDEGPFDGVIGFSQGASLAFAVASLLETGRTEGNKGIFPDSFLPQNTGAHPPLRFGIVYSGFRLKDHRYDALFENGSSKEPLVSTPVLHVMGTLDALVSEAMGKELIEACVGGSTELEKQGRVVFHPGGHFVPSQKRYLDAAVAFVRNAMENQDGRKEEKEERVEDMDVPF